MKDKNNDIILFSTTQIVDLYKFDSSNFDFVIWKPSFTSLKPPEKSFKYIFYSLFHFLGIFSSKNYSAVIVYKDKRLVASLLLVPKYYRWSFMKSQDIQIAYVLTKPEYRGKGLALKMIKFGAQKLEDNVDKYWYVTDSKNLSSIKLAKKAGFIEYKEY